jgi:hypothetical protein
MYNNNNRLYIILLSGTYNIDLPNKLSFIVINIFFIKHSLLLFFFVKHSMLLFFFVKHFMFYSSLWNIHLFFFVKHSLLFYNNNNRLYIILLSGTYNIDLPNKLSLIAIIFLIHFFLIYKFIYFYFSSWSYIHLYWETSYHLSMYYYI